MTIHFTSHFRRPIGVLAGLALLASLLVAVPGPIKAADPAPDYLPAFDACLEDVIPSSGFTDVSSRDPVDAINCIAYYGITEGTSATTYSPGNPVIREHMALFLIRLAKLVGIFVPPAGETPFEDIDELSDDSQEAISQLYQLRITIGANIAGTIYAPARNVTRAEMALFLQRLMDQMDVVADRNDVYGYIPDDVDDNDGDFDVESPFVDLDEVPHAVNEAVTHLYELGVASGVSSRVYGPDRNMSRAAMAEFMAAILDHSNLRPNGVTVQVSPTQGNDDFEIVMMISVRDDTFAPVDDQPVDWFYTDDSEDLGLQSNGECDSGAILSSGDCEWNEDNDDETNRDGNIFEDRLEATPGETMTFYAWIGSRDGDEFDEDDFNRDATNFSMAQALSDKGPSSLLVTHDVSPNAAQIDGVGAYLVDMDRTSSIEFTIQLRDEDGNRLEQEGVAIEIEIESREVIVDVLETVGHMPEPDFGYEGRASSSDETVVTDRRGEAVFEVEGPSNDERLDRITIAADCCDLDLRFDFAWSDTDPILMSARPDFDLYQSRPSSGALEFEVEYELYDQYGNLLRGHTERDTGRSGEVKATFTFQLYTATLTDGGTDYVVTSGNEQMIPEDNISLTRGRISTNVTDTLTADVQNGGQFGYLVLLTPKIYNDADDDGVADADEIKYIDDGELVWIVENARGASDLLDLSFQTSSVLKDLRSARMEDVGLYSADRKFRTFFTMWEYDSNDRFQSEGDSISVEEFEKLWEEEVDGVEDLSVIFYGSTSFFVID